jgi:hypothetical protein
VARGAEPVSILLFKSILATVFMAAGVVAVLSMLSLMGQSDRKLGPRFLRSTHKSAGTLFVILLVVVSVYCVRYVGATGDNLSLRAVIHGVLAVALFGVLFLKLTIIRFYKEFLRIVPTLGMIIFVLAFSVYFTSAGFYFLRRRDGDGREDGGLRNSRRTGLFDPSRRGHRAWPGGLRQSV